MEVTILGLSFGVGVSFFGLGVLAFGWPLGGFSRMSAALGVEAFLLSCFGSARRNWHASSSIAGWVMWMPS